MQQQQPQHAGGDLLFKLMVVGDQAVGKSCLLRRYIQGTYSDVMRQTIGVDFAAKATVHNGSACTLQLWDIAGQERSRNMSRTFYQNAIGALVVADLTNSESFAAATVWKRDIDAKVFLPKSNSAPLPVMLLLNKCDAVADDSIAPLELDQFCAVHSFVGWLAVSAREGTNVDLAFDRMIGHMVAATTRVQANGPTAAEVQRARLVAPAAPIQSKCPC